MDLPDISDSDSEISADREYYLHYIGTKAVYVTSQRGGQQLEVNRYLHRLTGANDRKKIFKCIRDDCKCRIHVNLDTQVISQINNWHQHSDDRLEVGKRVFRKALKDKTKQNIKKSLAQLHTETTREVYQQLDVGEYEKAEIHRHYLNYRGTVNRVKSNEIRLPKSVAEKCHESFANQITFLGDPIGKPRTGL